MSLKNRVLLFLLVGEEAGRCGGRQQERQVGCYLCSSCDTEERDGIVRRICSWPWAEDVMSLAPLFMVTTHVTGTAPTMPAHLPDEEAGLANS